MTRCTAFQPSSTRASRLFRTASTGGLVLAFLTLAHGAGAAPLCGKREEIRDRLDRAAGERPTSLGLDDGGRVVELFVSPGGRSWSLLITWPDGRSCMIASGRYWERIPASDGDDA